MAVHEREKGTLMAGFSKIYCLGELGGFQGADGINSIGCQFWVGNSDRQWWEAHYFDDTLSPLGDIGVVIPSGPESETALLDACLAFVPRLFVDCPSLAAVRQQAVGLQRLDFHLNSDEVPASWGDLQREARGIFENLILFEADLKLLDLRNEAV